MNHNCNYDKLYLLACANSINRRFLLFIINKNLYSTTQGTHCTKRNKAGYDLLIATGCLDQTHVCPILLFSSCKNVAKSGGSNYHRQVNNILWSVIYMYIIPAPSED